MNNTTLDIILPCYNPSAAWAENVIQSFNAIQNVLSDTSLGLIFINDGSAHGISESQINAIKKNISHCIYISYPENKGKGHALRAGIKISQAEFCIYTDIDFPYKQNSLLKIWQPLKMGTADIAIGIKDANYYKHVPAVRRAISKMLRWGSAKILRLKIADTQCGLKGFNTAGKQLFLQTTINRYLFDLEFIFLASKKKELRMEAIDIELKENIQFSSMRLGILLGEGFNFLKIFFKSL